MRGASMQQRRQGGAGWAAAAGACLLLSGCGQGAETTTVRGSVTYNGQPVTSGLINFMAEGARPLGGGVSPDGTYEFQLPPGEYKVRIDTPPAVPEGPQTTDAVQFGPRQVPEKYATYATSGLTATVNPGGEQTIDFALP